MGKIQDKIQKFSESEGAKLTALFLVVFALFALCSQTGAADVKKSQKGVDFSQRVSVSYAGGSLEEFMERCSKEYGFPYFIDRRVDASTLISCSVSDVFLIDAFDQALSSADLSFCVVDSSFLYVGPRDAANDALTLFEITRSQMELGEIPPKAVSALSSAIDFQIAPFAEPRDVFKALAKKTPRVKYSGFDKTTFDRWRGCSFENVSANNLLVVLTLGFDVEYYYDQASSSIKPRALKRDRDAVILYSDEIASKLSPNQFPECSFQREGLSLKVEGKFSDLVAVAKAAAQIRRDLLFEKQQATNSASTKRTSSSSTSRQGRKSESGQQVVDGNVKDVRLESLFNDLEKRLGIQCVLDSSLAKSGVTLDTRISCEFHSAGKEKIAAVIAQKINATPIVNDNEITFVAK